MPSYLKDLLLWLAFLRTLLLDGVKKGEGEGAVVRFLSETNPDRECLLAAGEQFAVTEVNGDQVESFVMGLVFFDGALAVGRCLNAVAEVRIDSDEGQLAAIINEAFRNHFGQRVTLEKVRMHIVHLLATGALLRIAKTFELKESQFALTLHGLLLSLLGRGTLEITALMSFFNQMSGWARKGLQEQENIERRQLAMQLDDLASYLAVIVLSGK